MSGCMLCAKPRGGAPCIYCITSDEFDAFRSRLALAEDAVQMMEAWNDDECELGDVTRAVRAYRAACPKKEGE